MREQNLDTNRSIILVEVGDKGGNTMLAYGPFTEDEARAAINRVVELQYPIVASHRVEMQTPSRLFEVCEQLESEQEEYGQ